MNNIEAIIEETKRKSALVNELVIDWQYMQQLIPQILNIENAKAPDFKIACIALHKMLDRTEDGIRKLKNIVPIFPEEPEIILDTCTTV